MSGTLLDLQKRMAIAVMEPLTRAEGSRRIRRDGIGMEREAANFIKPNSTLSSFERLEIYNRQYWFRLYASFEDDFPGLLGTLGRRPFERVMKAYLDVCPSTSYTLRDLGSRLHSFLVGRRDLTAPKSRVAEDVARLEWAHIEAYDAAAIAPAPPEFLASITNETVLRLQPSIQLLPLSYPVDEVLIAIRQDAASNDRSSNSAASAYRTRAVRRVAQLAPSQIWLAVHRQEFTVYYKRLEPEEYRMLVAIQAGASLGEVFAAGFSNTAMDEATQALLLQQAFQQWAILGWICTPESFHDHIRATGDCQ